MRPLKCVALLIVISGCMLLALRWMCASVMQGDREGTMTVAVIFTIALAWATVDMWR